MNDLKVIALLICYEKYSIFCSVHVLYSTEYMADTEWNRQKEVLHHTTHSLCYREKKILNPQQNTFETALE